jgi:hypothetical protein
VLVLFWLGNDLVVLNEFDVNRGSFKEFVKWADSFILRRRYVYPLLEFKIRDCVAQLISKTKKSQGNKPDKKLVSLPEKL